MNDLNFLDDFIDKKKSKKPTDMELTLYQFLKLGIDYNDFCKLPAPYIMSMIKCMNYEAEQESKASKKRAK